VNEKGLVTAPSESAAFDSATRAFQLLAQAFKQGGEASRETVVIQTSAIEKAHMQNAQLADRIVKMADLVSTMAEKSTAQTQILANRDIELAKIRTDNEFYEKLIGLAQSDAAKMIFGKLGFGQPISSDQKMAISNVIQRLLARPQVCSEIQTENPEEYAEFLKFVETLT
jgi:hypothetical protein